MKLPLLSLVALSTVLASSNLHAASLLSPNDFIIAIDGNRNLPGNTNTGGEGPQAAFDSSNTTKWFSGGRAFAGLIVTPATAGTVVNSMTVTSGNDSPERDPVSYQLYGTNAAVTSVNNDPGTAEAWTLISSGSTGLAPNTAVATARNTTGSLVSFANTTAYNSYKIVFTALRSANDNIFNPVTLANGATPNGIQLSEIRLFDNSSTNIFTTAPTAVVATDLTDSFFPAGERPIEAIDGSKASGSKHLNFGREGAGLIITPASGSSIANGIQVTTANDTEGRDPSDYQIFGTNGPILSLENSDGNAESWTLITNGTMALPAARNTDGPLISFSNSLAFTSYKVVFTENKGPDGGAVNSIQYSELQLFGDLVPEPSGIVMLGAAGLTLALRRRRVS